MSSITTELAEVLSTVQRPGNFYVAGTTEIFAPRLEVEGVGPIALPLLPVQVEQLVAIAEPAPYGRGEETLVDTQVRRTWQINADRIRIEGRHWQETLDSIVARVAEGLGVTSPVEAELYKLLVYDAGCFFVNHRDTEKTPGMFATLAVVLPSQYSGGELLIRHCDQEVRLDLRCSDPSEVAFAAFYADCVHEVLPITSGCRLTLVYNLVRPGTGQLPEPPSYEAEQSSVVKRLKAWAAGKALPDDDSPEKLIYALEHAYTPAALAFDALKGADAAVAAMLVSAAKEAECDIHLALVSIHESGDAEHIEYYGSRRRGRRSYWSDDDDDNDAYEIGDVYERSTTLTEWRRPDGHPTSWDTCLFEETELCPPDAFDGLEPDELHFQEASGNEGASFERTYQRAGLVLWPSARRLAVLNQTGLSVTLPYLDELTQRWIEGGQDPESPLWQEAHELSRHMLRTWSQKGRHTVALGQTTQMLSLLTQLRDIASIDIFLSDISATGIYAKGDNKELVQAVNLLSPQRIAELIERIVAGNAAESLSACGDLLSRSLALEDIDRKIDFIPAAKALVSALPGDSSQDLLADIWHRTSRVEADFIVDLLTVLGHLDATLADQAVDRILACPKIYSLDSVILPAVLALTEQRATREIGAVRRLREACLAHLRSRIAEPLAPPQDWTRDKTPTCGCPHCSELSLFLSAPDQKIWTFKANESVRRHVETSIRRSGCDLDFKTETRGRPYSLVCTKNQASYERRAQQRKKDLEDLAQLNMP
ncbi:MAG: 2OG-Fe(II) oxygenase [Thermosynechococcaceae cyanobacterium]